MKRWPRWHPLRIGYVAYSRLQERIAKARFDSYALPFTDRDTQPRALPNTAVTEMQLNCLLRALDATEPLKSTCIVEIGCYRGATTARLASHTQRPVYAVDPFIGYGGSEEDFAIFRAAIAGLKNVEHLRTTSGSTGKRWTRLAPSFVFIDAVHDYVNVRHDIATWVPLMCRGGLIALHDTDNAGFAGTRRAVCEASRRWPVYEHVDDLTILGPINV
jgi:hypothetical protein